MADKWVQGNDLNRNPKMHNDLAERGASVGREIRTSPSASDCDLVSLTSTNVYGVAVPPGESLADSSATTTAPPKRKRKRRNDTGVKRTMSEAYRTRLRLVIYLYREGTSASEIGEAIGVTKQRVLQLLRNAGFERRGCGNIVRAFGGYDARVRYHARARHIVALYTTGGLSTPEVAEQLHVCIDTVIRALRRAGVTRRKGIASWRGYTARRRAAAATSAA